MLPRIGVNVLTELDKNSHFAGFVGETCSGHAALSRIARTAQERARQHETRRHPLAVSTASLAGSGIAPLAR